MWEKAFIVPYIITFPVTALACYIVFANTLSSGHCRDNQTIIAEDIGNSSKAIANGAKTINGFDTELNKLNIGHNTGREYGRINLQIAAILFDVSGDFQEIERYE